MQENPKPRRRWVRFVLWILAGAAFAWLVSFIYMMWQLRYWENRGRNPIRPPEPSATQN